MNVEYWPCGYMKYNRDLHPHHGKAWKTSDIRYLIDRYYKDDVTDISLALGRTPKTVCDRAYSLRKIGLIKKR